MGPDTAAAVAAANQLDSSQFLVRALVTATGRADAALRICHG